MPDCITGLVFKVFLVRLKNSLNNFQPFSKSLILNLKSKDFTLLVFLRSLELLNGVSQLSVSL